MKIEIDINKIIELGLTPDLYVILYLYYKNDQSDIKLLRESMSSEDFDNKVYYLIYEGWMERKSTHTMKICDKFKSMFGKEDEVDNWIMDWIELFPHENPSGKYLRSNKKDVRSKMKKFIKKYDYTKDEIFKATKKYLEEQEKEGYAFTKMAAYFILKDNYSTLATECERIKRRNDNKADVTTGKKRV